MITISNIIEELIFNFMYDLQGWYNHELRHRGLHDLPTTMVVVEKSIREDPSNIKGLEGNNTIDEGNKVSSVGKGSSKTHNV